MTAKAETATSVATIGSALRSQVEQEMAVPSAALPGLDAAGYNSETSKQDTRQKQQEGRQHRLEAVSAHHRDSDTCVPHEESQHCEQHREDESDLGWR